MFKAPFSFQGRIRRTEYGLSCILYVLAVGVLLHWFIFNGIERLPTRILLMIPALWFIYAQSAKRCHDLGRSGWWQLIPLYFIWLLVGPGNPCENEYGENPRHSISVEDVFAEARMSLSEGASQADLLKRKSIE